MVTFLQSHPVGRGPEFVRNVFNIYGQSPLVAHFLRMKRLQEDAGLTVRIQRTEVESLPPYPFQTFLIFHSFLFPELPRVPLSFFNFLKI